MHIEVGYGGWLRAQKVDVLPEGSEVFVHFHRVSERGRFVPDRVYIRASGEERLRGEHLRRLPLDVFESVANGDGSGHVEMGLLTLDKGPDLDAAADRFYSGSGHHWDAIPRGRRPKLTTPPEGRYTDEWLVQLATAYNDAYRRWKAKKGEAPAKALATQAQVSVKTVHSWIYRARKAGALPPGKPGGAGA